MLILDGVITPRLNACRNRPSCNWLKCILAVHILGSTWLDWRWRVDRMWVYKPSEFPAVSSSVKNELPVAEVASGSGPPSGEFLIVTVV